jgi:hypothetical protein
MKTNVRQKSAPIYTHEGAKAIRISPYAELRRSVLSCLLWEDGFYENGQSIADRISALVPQCDPQKVAALAVDARTNANLRHVPLLLVAELAKVASGTSLVSDTLKEVIRRADEPAEFLSIYWRNGRTPLSKQVKKGLALALRKFNSYQLAKYNRNAAIKLRDVLFMVHAKPADLGDKTHEAEALSKPKYKRGAVMRHDDSVFTKLVNDTLEAPDTWEVGLSAGADKRETFERLLREGKLGYLALLRNLRNMTQAGVDTALVREAILARKGADVVLPFRYVAAARACPQMEPYLDQALSEAIAALPMLSGKTLVLVDVSGSMDAKLSAKSDLTRMDAAAALASLINGDVRTFTFSQQMVEVPPRRGMAGVDTIVRSQLHGGTALYQAVEAAKRFPHDRMIVITDEQAMDSRRINPVVKNAYMINVATEKHGIGYNEWTHIDGFSESVLRWIVEFEKSKGLE